MKLKLLGHSANDLFWFILPLILPSLLSRYSLSYTEAGGILTLYLLFTALGSFVMGRISDRISRRKILSAGFIIAAGGLVAAGFAPSLSIFLILISVTAIGVSTFHPVMYAVIDETYTENKGRILGTYECCGTAAILLMFLINGFLISRIGIRGVLIATALPSLAMGFLYRRDRGIPDRPVESGYNSETHYRGKGRQSDSFRLIVFLVTVILRVLSVTAVLNFLPTIFVHFFGMDGGPAAYSTAFFFAGGMAGSIFFGRISERFNSFGIILGGTFVIGLTLLALAGDLPVWIYLIIVAVFGTAASGCIINQNLVIARLGSSMGKGQVFGILMGTTTITSALSPALFGLIIDSVGYRDALYIFTAPLFVSMLILARLLISDKAQKAEAAAGA